MSYESKLRQAHNLLSEVAADLESTGSSSVLDFRAGSLHDSVLGCLKYQDAVKSGKSRWYVLLYSPGNVQPYIVANYINGTSEWITGTYFTREEDATKHFGDMVMQFAGRIITLS